MKIEIIQDDQSGPLTLFKLISSFLLVMSPKSNLNSLLEILPKVTSLPVYNQVENTQDANLSARPVFFPRPHHCFP